ncbi:MAG: hypothetical protein HFJ52_08065, partial [Clostridia bacterium]|nr:hypothetical protein [Clostridia bacterium]
EKSQASIYTTAEDKKHGIAKIELIYKDEVKQTKDKPTGEQKFDVSEIGTGWYKVKAISNSGAVKYEWVKVTNVSDKLTTPEITIETESIQKNGWYGADKKEVWIKISTNSPSAKTMHYTLSGAQTQAEKIESLSETSEGAEKSIRFQITEIGITNVVAWTQDETDKYQSEEARDSIKYDNKAPEITTIEENGTVGENGWYTSDIELKINAEDLNGKPKTEENTGLETLNGYNYTLLNGEGTELKSKTHITKIDTPIRTSEIAKEDGIYQLHITAEDKAGNESTTKVVTLQKDTKVPTIGIPQITEITETGFQLTISAGDETSGIAYYEYYINNTKIETLTEGIWTPNNLQPNSINNIKVIVYDNAGNKQESITTPVTTKGELRAPNIQISGDTRNGYYIGDVTIQVTDTSEANKTRVNRIKVTGAGSERTITGTSGSFTITADGTYTISAWSEDASGNKSDTISKPSFTRDATAPNPTLGTPTTNSNGTIRVTATANETGGSGVASYEFQYKTSTSGSWTRKELVTSTEPSYTYTYTGMGNGKTVYIRVLVTDGAGNIGKSAENSSNGTSAVIPSANTAPTVTASFARKTINSIVINATGRDKEEGKLTYTLYVKTASGSWQSKATTTGSPNSQVILTANDLSVYTDYYYKVDVKDSGGLTGTTGQIGTIKTYCPGKTICSKCYAHGYNMIDSNGAVYILARL